ncbi:hypothetical protein D9758_006923 [Tetrapyrgos nigripes]|uniref:G-protein coupled receptors family 2 profile 2 domain-containing protein n=1 Tax=Tetrapyrgos nigripes TaxID=182062 RepID=A0A8H5GS65_9AGAR|nr:hypothetical protein D9758_006923 [Tetrapyrgos nigripes]
MISLHLFNLLFRRGNCTKTGFWLTMVLGWFFIVGVVLLGPAFLETPEKGPYFGISGPWCWITMNYPKERIFLEYFFEFLSAIFSIVLYVFIILRVRGNLIRSDGRWHLRFVPREESWQLSFERDLIDQSMLRVAQSMVWFPVAYTIILIPITLTRLPAFAGADIPFGATVFGAVVFNSTGFVNVVLFLFTSRLFPNMKDVPEFNTKRSKHLSVFARGGITPFMLERSDVAELHEERRTASIRSAGRLGTDSNRSSVTSTTLEDMKDVCRTSFLSGQSQIGLVVLRPPSPASCKESSEGKSPVYYLSFTKEFV